MRLLFSSRNGGCYSWISYPTSAGEGLVAVLMCWLQLSYAFWGVRLMSPRTKSWGRWGPKWKIYGKLGRVVTFGIRAKPYCCLVVPTGASSSLSGLDFHIPHQRVRDWKLFLLRVLVVTCHTCFGASGSNVGSRHQEQNREGVKAQNEQYIASWVGLLFFGWP
jgi:hypothetical protein